MRDPVLAGKISASPQELGGSRRISRRGLEVCEALKEATAVLFVIYSCYVLGLIDHVRIATDYGLDRHRRHLRVPNTALPRFFQGLLLTLEHHGANGSVVHRKDGNSSAPSQ
jgi:hypothetical protein